jgi:hypothetical protein
MSQETAYLDTCIVSGLVKFDNPAESDALREIFGRYQHGEVSLLCSPKVAEEIADIPPDYIGPHLEMLQNFAQLPKSAPGGLTRMGADDYGVANPRRRIWRSLMEYLPDEPDAEHVFIAYCNRIKYLVTWDVSTMLPHSQTVFERSGVRVLLPSAFLDVLNGTSPRP